MGTTKWLARSGGGTTVVFNSDSLAVARGPSGTMDRVLAYLEAGPGGPEADGPAPKIERIVRALAVEPRFTLPRAAHGAVTRLNVGNTYHCNMGCTYCYNELDNKDRRGTEVKEGMTLETATAMVDALFAQSGEEPNLSLVFIGGEALLERAVLFATVTHARRLAVERGCSLDISVYTNGTLMDRKVVAWADENEVDLVLSMDGPPALHDKYRVYPNGRPTSQVILRNVRWFLEHSRRRWRRVNVVASEPRRLLPLVRYFRHLGFNDIHIQTAYGLDGFGQRGGADDLVEVLEWYKERLVAGEVFALAPFASILHRLMGERRNVTSWLPCTTGYSSLGVGPDGAVYPCHHFLEEGDFRLGDVRRGLPSAEARSRLMVPVDEREPCRSCWARHACGGECYHRASTGGRGYAGILEEACDGRRAVIGLTIELYAELARSSPEALVRLGQNDFDVPVPNPAAFEAMDLRPYGDDDAPRRAKRSLPMLNLAR